MNERLSKSKRQVNTPAVESGGTHDEKPPVDSRGIEMGRLMTGENLQAWRRFKKMSRYQLSGFIGCDPMTIRSFEAGIVDIQPNVAEDIADAFGVTVEAMDTLPESIWDLSRLGQTTTVLAEPIVTITDGVTAGSQPPAPMKFADPPARIGFEVGDSIDVSPDGTHWKRMSVYVELPCAVGDVDTTIITVKQKAHQMLNGEMQKMYAELAEQFNKPPVA